MFVIANLRETIDRSTDRCFRLLQSDAVAEQRDDRISAEFLVQYERQLPFKSVQRSNFIVEKPVSSSSSSLFCKTKIQFPSVFRRSTMEFLV